MEHGESTTRQYSLRERAVALGWPDDHIIVIDQDLGHSGASIADRLGFQRLVAEVGLGRVGLVLGLEVSRLARNSSDWHHLLEICALTHTLILDEDGLYDPATFNDRLLLGLKGTMSEAELYMIRARLQGGILSKARRGALKLPLPIGLFIPTTSALSWTRICRCKRRFGRCLPRLRRRVLPAQRCASSASSRFLFRIGSMVVATGASWRGERCSIMMSCVSCIIPAMRGPMSLDAHAPPKRLTAKSTFTRSPVRSGRWCATMPMLATLPGRNTSGIRSNSP